MTIRVCRKKLESRFDRFCNIVTSTMIVFFIWLPIIGNIMLGVGLCIMYYDHPMTLDTVPASILIFVGGFISIASLVIIAILGDSVYHMINRKLKLFGWNNDC